MPTDGSMTSTDYQAIALSDYMGDIGTAAINAASSKKEREAAQKHAEKMALESYQRDVEFWDKVNEYNSPLQKRLRLVEAGISPWTEYGQLNTEAPMVKSPVAETIAPTQGLQLPNLNMLGNFIAINKMQNETKQVQAALERTAVETKYKQLETDILQEYKNRQMINDLVFSKEQQNEARAEWNRLSAIHDEKIKEYKREEALYEHNKELWKYDEPAKKYELLEQKKRLEVLEQEVLNYQLRAEDLKQKYRIGETEEKRVAKELEIINDKERVDKEFRDDRLRIKKEYGIDMENTGWWTKTATEFTDWLNNSIKKNKDRKEKIRNQSSKEESRFQIYTPEL